MNASRLPKSTPDDESPLLETVPGPVAHTRVERQWFGLPARFVLLCLACAALGASIGLFATGNWGWGIALLILAAVFAGGLSEAVRQGRRLLPEQSAQLAADRRAQAATAAQVWRTRAETSMARWRIRARLDQLEVERPPALQKLGDAVHRGDKKAEKEARERLDELDERRQRLEAELDRRVAGAEERIRRVRLPVQQTLLVAPEQPSAPYPPPDEGDPPQPATVPEPHPPPDEGTPPEPDPGQADDE